MKLVLVLALAAAAACAAPQQNSREVQILRYDNDNAINAYRFGFEQSDGQIREEQGQLKNAGAQSEALSVSGSYSWVGPDGVTYVVTYVADENGFQPTIQQGPGGGVPPAVVASLLG